MNVTNHRKISSETKAKSFLGRRLSRKHSSTFTDWLNTSLVAIDDNRSVSDKERFKNFGRFSKKKFFKYGSFNGSLNEVYDSASRITQILNRGEMRLGKKYKESGIVVHKDKSSIAVSFLSEKPSNLFEFSPMNSQNNSGLKIKGFKEGESILLKEMLKIGMRVIYINNIPTNEINFFSVDLLIDRFPEAGKPIVLTFSDLTPKTSNEEFGSGRKRENSIARCFRATTSAAPAAAIQNKNKYVPKFEARLFKINDSAARKNRSKSDALATNFEGMNEEEKDLDSGCSKECLLRRMNGGLLDDSIETKIDTISEIQATVEEIKITHSSKDEKASPFVEDLIDPREFEGPENCESQEEIGSDVCVVPESVEISNDLEDSPVGLENVEVDDLGSSDELGTFDRSENVCENENLTSVSEIPKLDRNVNDNAGNERDSSDSHVSYPLEGLSDLENPDDFERSEALDSPKIFEPETDPTEPSSEEMEEDCDEIDEIASMCHDMISLSLEVEGFDPADSLVNDIENNEICQLAVEDIVIPPHCQPSGFMSNQMLIKILLAGPAEEYNPGMEEFSPSFEMGDWPLFSMEGIKWCDWAVPVINKLGTRYAIVLTRLAVYILEVRLKGSSNVELFNSNKFESMNKVTYENSWDCSPHDRISKVKIAMRLEPPEIGDVLLPYNSLIREDGTEVAQRSQDILLQSKNMAKYVWLRMQSNDHRGELLDELDQWYVNMMGCDFEDLAMDQITETRVVDHILCKGLVNAIEDRNDSHI